MREAPGRSAGEDVVTAAGGEGEDDRIAGVGDDVEAEAQRSGQPVGPDVGRVGSDCVFGS